MWKKINILNIKIDKVNMEQARDIVCNFIETDDNCSHMVVTPNAEMVVKAQNNSELAAILNQADLAVPDGAGIVLASHLLNKNGVFTERVAGFDLMECLFTAGNEKNYKIYLLGGEPGIPEQASFHISRQYPGLKIAGFHHGYLDKRQQEKVIEEINQLAPDLLLVGMGVPLQEKFLSENLPKLNIRVGMTVGGSFDVLAGKTERAPLWMQKAYLEWFFRLLKEPSRLSRMIALPRFVLLVLYQAIFDRGEDGNVL